MSVFNLRGTQLLSYLEFQNAVISSLYLALAVKRSTTGQSWQAIKSFQALENVFQGGLDGVQ